MRRRLLAASSPAVSGAILTGAALASRIGMALWSVLLARALGISDFGSMSVALAMLVAAQALSDAGAAPYLTRELAVGHKDATTLVRDTLWGQALLGILVGAVVVLLMNFMGQSTNVAVLTAIGVLIGLFSQVSRGLLRGNGLFAREASCQMIGTAGLIAATFLLRDSYSIVIALLTYIVAQLPLLLGSMGNWPQDVFKARPKILSHLKRTLPFNLGGTLSGVYLRSDVIVLGAVVGTDLVALYSAASQVFLGIISVAAVGGAVALRELTLAKEQDWRRVFFTLFAFFGLLGIIACGATYMASPYMARIFGPDFGAASHVLRVLAFGLPLSFLTAIVGQGLVSLGAERFVAWNFLCLVGFGLPLYWALATTRNVELFAAGVVSLVLMSLVYQLLMLRRVMNVVSP